VSAAPHVMVLHRWRDRYAHYEDYIDHSANSVTYISTRMGRASIPAVAAGTAEVAATDDFAAVRAAAERLAAQAGGPARVLALNEGDLDTAALLREHLGCPGQRPADAARFRDKLVMTGMVAAAGVRTPAVTDAPSSEAIEDFASRHGWPAVVKPRRGTASRAVVRLDGPADLPGLSRFAPEPRMAQAYCADPIYHIDGLWTGTDLGPWRASRYMNTPVGFNEGDVLGSIEVDDLELLPHLARFAADVAGALSDDPWVFHLEAFVGRDPGGAPRVSFLEVGYRAGGAEIPFIWREVHGADLMAAAAAIQLGQPVPALEMHPHPGEEVGGWLLVPTPVPAPCRVTVAELPAEPTGRPYASVVPPVGYVIPKAGGYEHVGARFRFRGPGTTEVENAIAKTASRFRLECSPVDGSPPKKEAP
jgi:hypothetical protein